MTKGGLRVRLVAFVKKIKLGIERYKAFRLEYIQPQLSRIEVFLTDVIKWEGKFRVPLFIWIYIIFLLEMPKEILSITIFGFAILPFISEDWGITFRLFFFGLWTLASLYDFFYIKIHTCD